MIDSTNELSLWQKHRFKVLKKIESGIKHEGNYFRSRYFGW